MRAFANGTEGPTNSTPLSIAMPTVANRGDLIKVSVAHPSRKESSVAFARAAHIATLKNQLMLFLLSSDISV